MKYVLLARPSSLIVKDMRHLISSTGLEPKPMRSLQEFENYNEADVAGIVISTALSSAVKDKYWDVIIKSMEHFPKKPIFLASYSSVKNTKITACQRMKESNISRQLLSLDEAKAEPFDQEKHILILTQKEISDRIKFDSIKKVVSDILHMGVRI